MIIWITTAIGLGLIAGAIAHTKGRSSWQWGVVGTLFGIVAVPYLLLSRDLRDERNWQPDRFGLPGRGGICPHCGTRVDADAVICRRCRKTLADYPSDKTATTGEAKPARRAAAAVSIEEASQDPMFQRLDDAFASLTVDRPTAARQGRGETVDPPAMAGASEEGSADGDTGTEDRWRYVHFSPISQNGISGTAKSRTDETQAMDRKGRKPSADNLVAEEPAGGGWFTRGRRWPSGGAGLPWNRRTAGVAALGALAVVVIVLAPHAVSWISRLSPPETPTAMEDSGLVTAGGGEESAVDPLPVEPRTTPSRPAVAAGPVTPPPPKPTPPDQTTGKPTAAATAVAMRETREPDALAEASPGNGNHGQIPATPKKTAPPQAADDFAGTIKKALADRRRLQGAHPRPRPSGGSVEISAAGEIVALVQQRLRERGYDPGVVDGRAGPRTQAAIRAFQHNLGRKADGQISTALLQHLGIVGQEIRAFQGKGMPTASR